MPVREEDYPQSAIPPVTRAVVNPVDDIEPPRERGRSRPALDALNAQLAPQPAIDKMPIQYGSAITLSYIGAAMRLALQGYRMQFVDVLDELLDLEPHGCAVIRKRIEVIAGARLEFTPADVKDNEKDRAKDICEMVRRQVDAIPYRTEHFDTLLWAYFYGLVGEEMLWRREEGEWRVKELGFIHSRRLSYPDYGSWDLYVWDQGMVHGLGNWPTQGIRGLRVADHPNKFLMFSPKVRGNYATREGIGRILAVNWALKRLVKRLTAQDFERFVKPWVIAYWATGDESGKPVPAEEDDIKYAQAAAQGLGAGSLSSVALPDSIKMMLEQTKRTTFEPERFVRYLDDESTKLALGQTFTTEPGRSGSRAASGTAKQDSQEGDRYLATCFSDMLRQELAGAIVRVNMPGHDRFIPQLTLHLDRPDSRVILEIASKLAASDVPVDGREVADQCGVALVPSMNEPGEDGKLPEIRMRPIKPTSAEGEAGEAPLPGEPDESEPDPNDEETEPGDEPKPEGAQPAGDGADDQSA